MGHSSSPGSPASTVERGTGGRHASGTETDRQSARVGVLSPHNSKETKAILNALEDLGADPVWIRDENVVSHVDGRSVTLEPSVDVLINRLLLTKSDSALEDLQLAALYAESVPVLNPPEAVLQTMHKYRASATLAAAGLPVPDAFFARSDDRFEDWPEYLPDEATHKPTVGTNGAGITRVEPGDAVGPRIDDRQAFVQEFLGQRADRPRDVRAYVVGGRVVGAMRRHAPDGDWRTNVALGGEVEGVTAELPRNAADLALAATDVFGLDVAGIDLLRSGGQWYVLEVNVTAGFKGLFEATGVSMAPHIAALALERAGQSPEQDAVERLEGRLDDAVPDCKPSPSSDPAVGGTLGFTNEVRVSGRDGSERAVAKADTGARRTSIDVSLAGRIGSGPLSGATTVRTARSGSEVRPLVELDIRLDGRWQTVTASVADRSEMSHPVLLGRDLLEPYTLDVSRTVEE